MPDSLKLGAKAYIVSALGDDCCRWRSHYLGNGFRTRTTIISMIFFLENFLILV